MAADQRYMCQYEIKAKLNGLKSGTLREFVRINKIFTNENGLIFDGKEKSFSYWRFLSTASRENSSNC